MSFLPIVERELRVAARRRATYWTRVAAALTGVLVAGCVLVLSEVGSQFLSGQLGPILFGIYSWLSFIFVCLNGVFLTSDCLSEEKREGTLGLLFLTDLRGHDVVAGKLLATSLCGAYGLLAVFPVFALTFLLGGVTGSQIWRLMTLLCNTLFFSLSAGVWISSLSRDSQRAMNGTLLVCAVFVLILPAIDWLIVGWNGTGFVPRFSFASPSFAFSEVARRTGFFWFCMALVNAVGWLFFGLACFFAPRTWQEKVVAVGAADNSPLRRWRYGSPQHRAAFRHRLFEGNPIRWLVGRDLSLRRLVSLILVSLILLSLAGTFLFAYLDRRMAYGLVYLPSALLSFIFVLWVALQASGFFVEARRNGAMELLLVSPASVEEIVQGCWWALRRAFLLPAIMLLMMKIAAAVTQVVYFRKAFAGMPPATAGPMINMAGYQVMGLVAGLVLFVTGTIAVAWFGMWMGLTSRTSHLAVIKTIAFTKVLPWFPLMFVQGILMAVVGFSQRPFWLVPVIGGSLSLAVDLALILIARRQLLSQFREIVTRVASPILKAKPPPLVAAIRPVA